ncbi:MAG TPA: hypothetical protein VLV78_01830 [Thermoanaerobaculia bacterium]|nr:hypothetical protein [Thermoanaerobaculia bacterium]
MENREKDKLSRKSNESTSSDEVNREAKSRRDPEESDSNADFGRKIGQSDDIENEPTPRQGGAIGSSGRSDSSENEH